MNRPTVEGVRRNPLWFWCQVLLRIFFVGWLRYRAHGVRHVPGAGAALLVANHQSFLDPLLVGLPLARPVSYLARDSLFRVPIIGWILRHAYVIPISRERVGGEAFRRAVERLERGFLVGVFPEGTRTPDGRMRPFKPGFLAILRRAEVPVIPVGIAGAFDAFPRGSYRIAAAPVTVVFGEPITVSRSEAGDRQVQTALVCRIEDAVRRCQQQAERLLRERNGGADF
ncbi:MAG: 1-acyl-sn-glycerol-3-phosphate acyltransferase [Planctomycetota bacterium]|nr:MAG: 1-acyl-sn-glycerol-3-phosphate acyltransferase [Planctomycetota bacterium]